jgi:aldose 1-epimerase
MLDEGRFGVTAGGHGWPWRYSVTQQVRVADDGVALELSLRNLDDAPMPAGIGIHPWYAGTVTLQMPAANVQIDNAQPLGRSTPVLDDFDLRTGRVLPRGADGTWSALSEQRLRMRASHWGFDVTQSFSLTVSHVAIARPTDFEATAVEPQTHAPDGLERLLAGVDGGMAVLPPGDELAVNFRWAVWERNDGHHAATHRMT